MIPTTENVPDIEKWKAECRNASDEQLLKLRKHAIDGLEQTQRWSPLIKIAEDELRRREIEI